MPPRGFVLAPLRRARHDAVIADRERSTDLNRSTEQTTRQVVHVGARPAGFALWESAVVCLHGFADLPSAIGDDIESHDFTCCGNQWRMSIYPGGNKEEHEGMVSVYLRNISEKRISGVAFFFSARCASGEEVACSWEADNELTIFKPCNDEESKAVGKGYFAKRSTILDALEVEEEGTLTIEVHMRLADPTKMLQFVPENPICKNILKKFMDEESADIIFEVGGDSQRAEEDRKRAKTSATTTFHAHRFVLLDGAPTLAEMCKPGGGEVSSVSITDVTPDIFRHLLYYVYGGKVADEDMETSAKDIIEAADKFGVVNLKLEAEACYVETTTLNTNNVLDNLLYADAKNCALLKEAVMDYLVENGDEIMDEVCFDDVPGSVVTDLLAAVSRGKRKREGIVDNDPGDFNKMRVCDLRKMLNEKGLDVDGSREAMAARLRESS